MSQDSIIFVKTKEHKWHISKKKMIYQNQKLRQIHSVKQLSYSNMPVVIAGNFT
jgi:hypothetical protein